MAKKPDWDFALRIRGVTLKTLPVSSLADYLKELVGLMGEGTRPVLDGIVKGSVVVRVRQTVDHAAQTRNRLQIAANDPEGPGARHYARISAQMERDGAHGEIVDRAERVVVTFEAAKRRAVAEPELIVSDTATLDGKVISVAGIDETIHVRLLDKGGVEHKLVVRKLDMARELAARFRGGAVRVHVHGTWHRTAEGKWEAHQLYADSIEDLDDSSPAVVFEQLRTVRTGWADAADPLKEWAEIRGVHDLHH